MKTSIIKFGFLYFGLLLLSGCYSYSDPISIDTPWDAYGKKSNLYLDSSQFYTACTKASIRHEQGGKLERICAKADRFLQKMPYKETSNNIYESTFHELLEYCRNNDCGSLSNIEYCNEKMIVCLDPLVVVFTGKSIADYSQSIIRLDNLECSFARVFYVTISDPIQFIGLTDGDYVIHYEKAAPSFAFSSLQRSGSKQDILLAGGYTLGTYFPDTGEAPLWFSPDMNIPPQELSTNDEGVGLISVPWGKLKFSKDKGIWNVTCVVD